MAQLGVGTDFGFGRGGGGGGRGGGGTDFCTVRNVFGLCLGGKE